MALLVILFVLANDLFELSPWDLPVKPKDIGLVLIMLGLVQLVVFKRSNLAPLFNAFTLLIFAYIFLVLVQVPLATINYDQPLVKGLIASRQQLYYLSFFLFLLILRTPEQIIRLMNILSVVALFALVLAIIDYSGIRIFHYQFADDITIRSGIDRAYVPAMDILSMAYLWNVSRWAYSVDPNERKRGRLVALVLLAGHFFRQGRFRLFSVLVASVWQLLVKGKVAVVAGMGLVGVVAILIASFTMETNLIVNLFVSGVEDATQQTGTAAGRLKQLETDIAVFKEYPYFGSGSAALSSDEGQYADLVRKTDLGYTHWLKHYGMTGIAWLLLLILTMFFYTRKLQKSLPAEYRAISAFCSSFLIFFVVSFLTLNHLMFRGSTLAMCLYFAILVRMAMSVSQEKSPKPLMANRELQARMK